MAMYRCVGMLAFTLAWMCWVANSQQGGGDPEDPTNPHRDPSKCEVCKLMATELQGMMEDTGKTREVLELGYRIDQKHKRIPYKFSELRLIETLEGICDRIMEYNIHAERKNSRRFAKGMSETFSTLHGLVNKGVKVELGIPYNMWDEPSAPVHTLRKLCDQIVEEHEESIEHWFRGDQKKTLTNYLCAERVLSREESECLNEDWTGTERVEHHTEEEKDDKDSSSENSEENDEDDPEKKKQAELDKQKVQREIERQAKEQQNQQEQDQVDEKKRERDRKKREKEMERRRREREDKDGDKKMNRERDDKRKVEREIQRQAERERMMREKHGDDYFEKRRRDREMEWEKERDRRMGGRGERDRRGGRDHRRDYDDDDHDRYMEEELAHLRRGHHFDADEYVNKIMERERREREERIRSYRNEL